MEEEDDDEGILASLSKPRLSSISLLRSMFCCLSFSYSDISDDADADADVAILSSCYGLMPYDDINLHSL